MSYVTSFSYSGRRDKWEKYWNSMSLNQLGLQQKSDENCGIFCLNTSILWIAVIFQLGAMNYKTYEMRQLNKYKIS